MAATLKPEGVTTIIYVHHLEKEHSHGEAIIAYSQWCMCGGMGF